MYDMSMMKISCSFKGHDTISLASLLFTKQIINHSLVFMLLANSNFIIRSIDLLS